MTKGFTCWGNVCGSCGIIHKTEDAAYKCCNSHSRRVDRGHVNAYSDRYPWPAVRRNGRIIKFNSVEDRDEYVAMFK